MRVDDVAMFGTAGPATPEFKAAMQRHCTTPAYTALVKELVAAMTTWVLAHRDADLRWKNTSKLMVLGDPELPGNLWKLGDSEGAVACLEYADHATNKRASLFTLQCALWVLGWMEQ